MHAASQKRIEELVQALRPKAIDFYHAANDEIKVIFPGLGARIVISQGLRTELYQMGLYTIGRRFDRDGGVWISDESKIVTRATPSQSKHCRGEAFDIAVTFNGVYAPLDPAVPKNKSAWLILANIGLSLGLKPGALWSKPDYPHYEI